MKPTKQTVYLPVEDKFKGADFLLKNWSDDTEGYLNKTEGYFFTPEQLNEYTANVVRQALETAAENAEVRVTENVLIEDGSCYTTSDKQSITNTFEETFNKLKV